jgi:hypothetical protein
LRYAAPRGSGWCGSGRHGTGEPADERGIGIYRPLTTRR